MSSEQVQRTTDTSASSADAAGANLSLRRVVGSMQVMLATRRAARNAEHAFLYTVTKTQ